MKKGSIVIFSGSFNPPLNSHFSIAQQVINQFEEVEKVIFVPINKASNKKGLLENLHRYNMLNLVIDKNEKFEVSDMDFKDEKSSFTIESLEEIQKQFPDKQIWYIVGTDNLKKLYTWKRAEDLVSKYKILVMERENDSIQEIVKENPLYAQYRQNFIAIDQGIRSNYNSTYVRNQIKRGKSVRYLLPNEVLEYIEKNKLYR